MSATRAFTLAWLLEAPNVAAHANVVRWAWCLVAGCVAVVVTWVASGLV